MFIPMVEHNADMEVELRMAELEGMALPTNEDLKADAVTELAKRHKQHIVPSDYEAALRDMGEANHRGPPPRIVWSPLRTEHLETENAEKAGGHTQVARADKGKADERIQVPRAAPHDTSPKHT